MRSSLCLDILVLSLFSLFFRTAGPEIFPSQTYDYDTLTSFALNSGQLADWNTTTGQAEVASSESEARHGGESGNEQ